ncbi:ABC transporter ATP-binding protein [Myroides sp. LJL119]
MNKIIQISDLWFSYGKESILQGVEASFEQGKFSIILGRNGSGKSTLFQILTGMQTNYSGSVLIGDLERKNLRIGAKTGLRIGFLNQFHQTTFPFRVYDVVLTGRSSFFGFRPTKQDYLAVEQVLKKFDLYHLKDKPYTGLSGGQRQLILLCRVLVQSPDILLLDEPTNHLDLHYQIRVLQTLEDLALQGTTVICVMHDPNLALSYGDDLFVMRKGKLVDLSTKDISVVHQELEKTYKIALDYMDNQGQALFFPTKKTRFYE